MSNENVSERILHVLEQQGVQRVFILPSARVLELSEGLARSEKLEPVIACHEMAAVYMADGYARATGHIGVAVTGGGPGALYALPAAVNARLESVPVFLITGGGPSGDPDGPHFQNVGRLGSRDFDHYSVGVETSQAVEKCDDFSGSWDVCLKALGNKRPAHLLLPMDLQSEPCPPLSSLPEPTWSSDDERALDTLLTDWQAAQSPLLILGHRLARFCSPKVLEDLSARLSVPVMVNLEGMGLIASSHPLYRGSIGYGDGLGATQGLLSGVYDHALVIGAGPGQRDGMDWEALCARDDILISRIDLHGDRPEGEFHPHRDLRAYTLKPVLEEVLARQPELRGSLTEAVAPEPVRPGCKLETYLSAIQDLLGSNVQLFVDAGMHRISVARVWQSRGTLEIHSSAEYAPMGWAIGAAIGASFAKPDAQVICLTGDGSMRMMGQELATAAMYGRNVLYLVVNNGEYGTLAATAPNELHRKKITQLSDVDWVGFSRALGGDGARIESLDDLKPALERMTLSNGPFVLDLIMDSYIDVVANV